jgi:hypothetical protein
MVLAPRAPSSHAPMTNPQPRRLRAQARSIVAMWRDGSAARSGARRPWSVADVANMRMVSQALPTAPAHSRAARRPSPPA